MRPSDENRHHAEAAHARQARKQAKKFVEEQALEIANEGGCHFSPSGWTAMLIVEELQRIGAAFKLEFGPGLGILVECASLNMKSMMETVGKYGKRHELL